MSRFVEVTFDHPNIHGDTAEVNQNEADVSIEATGWHVVAEKFKDDTIGDQREHHGEHLQDQQVVEQLMFKGKLHSGKGISAGRRKE